MKKTFTYLRTLLVGLMAVTATGTAWADATTLLEYGTSKVAWTTANLAEWTAGGSPTLTDGIVTISGGNGSYETSKTIEPTAYSIINVKAIWRGSSNTGRAFSAGNGSYFRFGNIIIAQNDQDKKHGYGFTGLANISSVTTFAAGSYRVDIANCTWLLIEMEINTAKNTLTSFTIKSEDGTKTYASTTNVPLTGADYTTIAFGYKKGGGVSTTNTEQLKEVTITETKQVVSSANYTVKYVCDDVEVKDASVRTGVVGQNIALASDDIANFIVGSKKYIYVSSDVEGKTVTSDGTVVTVTFREAATYNYTVVSDKGVTLNSGSNFEGESPRVGYPRYQKDGAALYMAAVDNKEYRTTVNLTEDNVTKTVTYTLQDGKVVAYYIEGEDIDGMTVATNDNIPVRASNAKAAKSDEDVEITTLPAGKYKLHVGIFTSKSGFAGNKVNFGIGAEVFNAEFTSANLNEIESEEYTINATTSIKYLGSTSWGGAEFDYIWIEKTGDAEEITSVAVTVGEAGWATYIAPYALNFSDVAGLTAYTASCDGSTVTLTEVDNVPAGTGVVLKGAAKDYNIPIIASSSTAKGDLKGSVSEATTADGTQYILYKTGDNAQFVQATNPSTIAAGKAYLVVAGGTSRLNVVMAGEATGIKAIEAAEAEEGIYNLQGQRVAKTQKGLYIVNGKKAIVK